MLSSLRHQRFDIGAIKNPARSIGRGSGVWGQRRKLRRSTHKIFEPVQLARRRFSQIVTRNLRRARRRMTRLVGIAAAVFEMEGCEELHRFLRNRGAA